MPAYDDKRVNDMSRALTKSAAARRWALIVLAAAAALLALPAAGCQQNPGGRDPAAVTRPGGEEFRPDDRPRAVHRFTAAQSAAGARNDAALRPQHFDGPDLNSLGQEKLDLMLKDDGSTEPLVVYLDVPMDGQLGARREAIRVYLKDRGLNESQVRLEPGPNPATSSPAAPGVAAKKLIESGAPVGTNPEPTGSPGAAPATPR
jgi:hypothetical protein